MLEDIAAVLYHFVYFKAISSYIITRTFSCSVH